MYKVTLAMPVYNVAPYVERALLSALNQTFESIEFLIVDDRGTDNSMDIVRSIIQNHPRGKDVRIIEHPNNIGLGATRNTAIDNAQGKYLYFMDSDDEITPDCIQLLYDKMMESPVDFVASFCDRINSQGEKVVYYEPYQCLTYKSEKGESIIGYLISNKINICVTTWNKLYDLEFLRKGKILCIPKHINEDLLFYFQLVIKARSFTLIPNITYHYYIISNSVTDRQSWTQKRTLFIINQCIEILEFKVNMLKDYKNEKWFYNMCRSLAFEAYNNVNMVLNCKIENKRDFINRILDIPFSIYKPSLFDKAYLIWIISQCPYMIKIAFLRLTYKIVFIKKKLGKCKL